MRPSFVGYTFAVLLALAGCSRTDPPATTPAQASSTPVALQRDKGDTGGDMGEKADLALALAPAHGTAAVDVTLATLEASAQKNPRKADHWILLGRAWIRKARESSDPGYYAHADAAARIALGVDPSNRTALDLSAMVKLNDHKFEEARAIADSVTAVRPDDPTAYGTLSDALLELGRFDEAAAATQTMVDLKPNLPSYSRASYVRWLQGDVASATEIIRHAMDAGGDSRDTEPLAWVLVQAGMMFWQQGDYEGADAGFDRALASFSEFPPALVGKARVALAEGHAARAAELLERAFRASPLAETAWLLGDARAAAGDAQGSLEAYAHVEKEGKLADGRTLALFLATKNQKPELALKLVEAEKKTRGDIYTDDTYAWALYRNGRFAEAQKAIDHATRLGTKDARLLYHAGAIRVAAGHVQDGRKLVQRALDLNPHFDPVGEKEARELLASR
jgi:tetratricopeptide (TPR) repeat protein